MSSPSLIHEGVIALVRDKPAFAASLLRDLFDEEIPPFDDARLTEASLNDLVPVEYHADVVVLFDIVYENKKPVFGTIFEVQLDRKERKGYTWPLYGVAARALRMPVRRDGRDARSGRREVGQRAHRMRQRDDLSSAGHRPGCDPQGDRPGPSVARAATCRPVGGRAWRR
jgi:hypothetical protein